MNKKHILLLFLFISTLPFYGQNIIKDKQDERIFVFGGDINKKFIQYIIELTDKTSPKICYIPTASGDHEDNIKYWEFICNNLSIEPHILKVWISSRDTNESFEDILLNMDAIVVGGGNTLNMLGIWKAQGIDKILLKALKKGIILSGGSAGSICWFQNGVSDSRPIKLSIVDGLDVLPYSNCPHYSDSIRKELFHQEIKNKNINAGYAQDDLSGILFKNGKLSEVINLNDINNSYYVALNKGKVISKKLEGKIYISKNAIPENSYTCLKINKKIKEYPVLHQTDTPLNAFISIKYIFASGKDSQYAQYASEHIKKNTESLRDNPDIKEERREAILNIPIDRVLIYKDSLAGVISEVYEGLYGVWFFYKENNEWKSAGEDIGGNTPLEAEITFREKAAIHMNKIKIPIY